MNAEGRGGAAGSLEISGQTVWVMAKGYAPDEGGMQTYAAGVAQAYAHRGASVTVFTQTSLGPRRERQGNILLVDVGSGPGVMTLRRLLTVMKREASTDRPVFVHGTTWRTSVLPLMLGLNYITTFHGREFMGGGPAARGVMRLIARRARGIVAVSQYTSAKLQRRLGLRSSPLVAYNGASIVPPEETALQLSPRPPLIFSLCRLEPRKNIAACIEACAVLKQRGRAYRYVIAGRGPELERLRALVDDLDLGGCVELVGYVSDAEARTWYERAEIFLHPQIEIADGRDFEGFGIVIADAMVSASAVVVGCDGGPAELVEHGISGFVVNGRDRDQLIEGIDKLLLDDGLRQSLARAARRRGHELFSWSRHIDIILDALGDRMSSLRR
jgi:glycosyltransferase involved in cell wall biosynthesis